MSTDWFRNATWNEAIERAFDEKLRRARSKAQRLIIQASTLVRSHPEVALKLLDRYFQLPDDIFRSGAHVSRAEALLALGRIEEAIGAYEAALACEEAFPNILTQAYLDLPYLVATNKIRERYEQALGLLGTHEARLTEISWLEPEFALFLRCAWHKSLSCRGLVFQCRKWRPTLFRAVASRW